MALSKSVLSGDTGSRKNNEEIITVKVCFKEHSNPEAARSLETVKHILENAAVDIILKRYMEQVGERRKNAT